jgi:type VI secretion system Hcp family effector
MEFGRMRRLVLLCGVAAVFLPAVQAMAAVDAYMIVKGARQGAIKGDSATGDVQLTGVVKDTTVATGATSGKRMHSTITITKKIDMASPKLAMASSSHELLSQVTIVFNGGGPGTGKLAQKIDLTNATIQSVRKVGGSEEITLDYQTIEVTYTKGGKSATDDWSVPN